MRRNRYRPADGSTAAVAAVAARDARPDVLGVGDEIGRRARSPRDPSAAGSRGSAAATRPSVPDRARVRSRYCCAQVPRVAHGRVAIADMQLRSRRRARPWRPHGSSRSRGRTTARSSDSIASGKSGSSERKCACVRTGSVLQERRVRPLVRQGPAAAVVRAGSRPARTDPHPDTARRISRQHVLPAAPGVEPVMDHRDAGRVHDGGCSSVRSAALSASAVVAAHASHENARARTRPAAASRARNPASVASASSPRAMSSSEVGSQ